MSADEVGFLSRWAQRKEAVRRGGVVEATPVLVPVESVAPVPAALPAAVEPAAPCVNPAEPLPTLADVALLTRDSDYSRFVGVGVDNGVKQAAMKKLFTDPHFNVMDGLDTYIADYGQPDPIPLAMLRQMNQSRLLGLFDDEEKADAAAVGELAQATALPAAPAAALAAAPTEEVPHDDLDLRLQQDHDAGWAGPREGPRA